MRAGFSSVDITPAVGCTLNGFIARLSPSTGVDLPLYARALLLESKNTRCLIVSFDTLGLSPAFADHLVADLAQLVSIPTEHVVLGCSHTHSGPMTAPLRGIGPADQAYLRLLQDRARLAARQAADTMRTVSVSCGTAPVHISVNRRQIMDHDGKAVLGVNPNGPRDPFVRVLQFKSEVSSCILFEHPCHAGILAGEHTLISPDFWGHAAKTLHDAGHDCIYLNGCGGDIAPVMAYGGPNASRKTGRMLADSILKACSTSSPLVDESLAIDSVQVDLPYDAMPPVSEIEKTINAPNRTVRDAEKQNSVVLNKVRSAWQEWLDDLKHAVRPDGTLNAIRARLSVIRIGQAAIIALPGEVFYGIGERMASRLNADPVCVAAYTHGYIGYVPDAEAFKYGGYEVDESHRYVGLWRLSPQSESILAKQVLRLWQQLGGTIQ